ncbi:MAG: hypothetical protein C0424_05975 [Sphingobacteriaceae bacterium]|nr:hypothetical protein [Sphingobacteriaceae bacterium]
MRVRFFAFLFSLLPFFGLSQSSFPAAGFVYDDLSVSRINVFMSPDSLNHMLAQANWYTEHEYPASMVFIRGPRRDSIALVGIRLRGNFSRSAAKKSFRISVNTFVQGQRYEGYKDFNLISGYNDLSISRNKVYADIARGLNTVASRIGHTELYINGQYRGLYMNVEVVNEDFVQTRYGNQHGNLYKCLFPADLVFISNDPNAYKFMSNGRRPYELKTNTPADNYSDLAQFIRVLHQTPANQIHCALDTLLNVEDYLLNLAIDITAGHWDGYYNKNNFYLYNNQRDKRFEYIPYDTDNTLGIDWMGIDWATISPYQFKPNQPRPLYEKMMANAETRAMFNFYLRKVSQYVQTPAFISATDNLRLRITPSALADPFKSMAYGFTNSQFEQSFTHTNAIQHVKKGIFPFLQQRSQNNLQALPANLNVAPIVHRPRITQLRVGQQPHVLVRIEDESMAGVQAHVVYTLNGVQNQTALYDDGLHNDGAAGDGWYGTWLPLTTQSAALGVQVLARDASQQQRLRPCNPLVVQLNEGGPLFINELLADNSRGIRDEANVASDWIELYNHSDAPYFLNGHTLTDNPSNPAKWTFPNDTIAPYGHYLVWASSFTARGPRHTNFGLAKEGEYVGVYRWQGGQSILLDSVSFGAQLEDVSYGRSGDGGSIWTLFGQPTPRMANGFATSSRSLSKGSCRVYPNPSNGSSLLSYPLGSFESLHAYDAQGREVFSLLLDAQQSATQLPEMLSSGHYLLVLQGKQQREVVRWVRLP